MRILMIAPACDGEDVGEAWVAFQWAKLASERFDLTLLTTYKRGHTPPGRQLPGVRVIEWEEPPGVGRFERLNSLMQPGYAPFYLRARRWIKQRLAWASSSMSRTKSSRSRCVTPPRPPASASH